MNLLVKVYEKAERASPRSRQISSQDDVGVTWGIPSHSSRNVDISNPIHDFAAGSSHRFISRIIALNRHTCEAFLDRMMELSSHPLPIHTLYSNYLLWLRLSRYPPRSNSHPCPTQSSLFISARILTTFRKISFYGKPYLALGWLEIYGDDRSSR